MMPPHAVGYGEIAIRGPADVFIAAPLIMGTTCLLPAYVLHCRHRSVAAAKEGGHDHAGYVYRAALSADGFRLPPIHGQARVRHDAMTPRAICYRASSRHWRCATVSDDAFFTTAILYGSRLYYLLRGLIMPSLMMMSPPAGTALPAPACHFVAAA